MWFSEGWYVILGRLQNLCLRQEIYKMSLWYFVVPESKIRSDQSLSRVQLCDLMDCSTPGLPVHHQLPEFTQTHVHQVGDAIQPPNQVVPFSSCLQSLPASGSFPMSQLFTWGGQNLEVRESLISFFLHVAAQFFQHHLLKRLSFLHCIFLPFLSKVRCP